MRYDAWVADIGDDQLLALYEDMVVIRRIDTEATALQRQGELGLWPPLLGQEAAQIGSGRALRRDDFVFSSYRENGVAYCRGAAPAPTSCKVWRGVAAARLEPVRHQHGDPAGDHRRPDPARDRLRARHPGRRHGRGRGRLLRRRRHERGRRERGDDLRRHLRGAGHLLLPEQPVGDLRAGRAAGAAADRRARARLRHPEHPRRRQRRARRDGRDPCRARPRPQRRRPDLHRGGHLPDGSAHHRRRPHPLPRPGRARGVEGEGPDRPASSRSSPRAGLLTAERAEAVAADGRRGRRRAARRLHRAARPRPDERLRQRLRRGAHRARPRSATTTAATCARSSGGDGR